MNYDLPCDTLEVRTSASNCIGRQHGLSEMLTPTIYISTIAMDNILLISIDSCSLCLFYMVIFLSILSGLKVILYFIY